MLIEGTHEAESVKGRLFGRQTARRVFLVARRASVQELAATAAPVASRGAACAHLRWLGSPSWIRPVLFLGQDVSTAGEPVPFAVQHGETTV